MTRSEVAQRAQEQLRGAVARHLAEGRTQKSLAAYLGRSEQWLSMFLGEEQKRFATLIDGLRLSALLGTMFEDELGGQPLKYIVSTIAGKRREVTAGTEHGTEPADDSVEVSMDRRHKRLLHHILPIDPGQIDDDFELGFAQAVLQYRHSRKRDSHGRSSAESP